MVYKSYFLLIQHASFPFLATPIDKVKSRNETEVSPPGQLQTHLIKASNGNLRAADDSQSSPDSDITECRLLSQRTKRKPRVLFTQAQVCD